LLNDYFTLVEEALSQRHGVVDKFVGDTVMAVFHPRGDEVGATVRAAQAALAIHDLIAPLNAARQRGGQAPIVLGVGIATGTVISGRIGSERGRLDQTVIGNAVNLAARLQQQALAHAPNGVIVDPACIRYAHGELRVEFIARVPIKGRSRTFPLYRLVGCRTRA